MNNSLKPLIPTNNPITGGSTSPIQAIAAEGDQFLATMKAINSAALTLPAISSSVSGSSSSSGSVAGSNSSNQDLAKSNQLLTSHSQSVSNLIGQYQKWDNIKSSVSDTKGLEQIDKYQKSIAQSLQKQAQSAQEYSKYSAIVQQHTNNRPQPNNQPNNQQSQQRSNNPQLNTINRFAQADFLRDVGQAGQKVYNTSMGAYTAFTDKYGVNNSYTQSERNLQASRLNLGRNLSGYQAGKNNLEAGFNNSGVAAPFAIGADVLGKAFDVAGTVLPAIGGLKALGGLGKSLSGVGKAAAVIQTESTAVKAASVAGNIAQKGAAAEAGLGGLLPAASKGLTLGGGLMGGGVLAGSAFAGAEVGKFFGNLINKAVNPGAKDQDYGDIFETVKKGATLLGSSGGKDKGAASHIGSILGVGPNDGTDIGSAWADLWGDNKGAEKIRNENVKKDIKADTEAKKKEATEAEALGQKNLKEAFGGSAFAFASIKTNNSIADFNYDQSKNIRLTQREYARGQQDRSLATSRATEDRDISLSRLNISRDRTVSDYKTDKSRLAFDTNESRQRSDQDYTHAVAQNELEVYRIKRDTSISLTHLSEDQATTRLRTEMDLSKNLSRVISDGARDQARLQEDAQTSSLRASQQYSRSILELNRNVARSRADLNTGFKDSTISLFAPGLAGSKAYQYSKLVRDYKKNSNRLTEDEQFQRQGLDIQKGQADFDIAKGLSRGTADIAQNVSRSSEDAAIERSRMEENLAREKSRTSFELLTKQTDALTDAQHGLTEINISHSRQQADITKADTRGNSDLDKNFSRSLQDFQLQESEINRQYARTMTDIGITAKRASEDLKEAMTQMRHGAEVFARDMNVYMSELGQQMAKDAGLAPGSVTVDKIRGEGNIGNINTGTGTGTGSSQGQNGVIGGGSAIGAGTIGGDMTAVNPNVGPGAIGGSNGAGTNVGAVSGNIGGGSGSIGGLTGGGGIDTGSASGAVSMLPASLVNQLRKQGGKVPSYAVGNSFIPYDQLAYIHRGEAVVTAANNQYAHTSEGVSLESGSQFNPDGSRKTQDQINASIPYARTSEGVSLQNGNTSGENRGAAGGGGNFSLGSDGRSDPNSNLRYGTWHGFQNPAWGGSGGGGRLGTNPFGRMPSIYDLQPTGDRMGFGMPNRAIVPPASSSGHQFALNFNINAGGGSSGGQSIMARLKGGESKMTGLINQMLSGV